MDFAEGHRYAPEVNAARPSGPSCSKDSRPPGSASAGTHRPAGSRKTADPVAPSAALPWNPLTRSTKADPAPARAPWHPGPCSVPKARYFSPAAASARPAHRPASSPALQPPSHQSGRIRWVLHLESDGCMLPSPARRYKASADGADRDHAVSSISRADSAGERAVRRGRPGMRRARKIAQNMRANSAGMAKTPHLWPRPRR